jgi:tellurite resistance protein TerA
MVVRLEKGEKVSMVKRNSGIMKLILAWALRNHRTRVDLDLVCLWEDDLGRMGAVQGLGEHFGCLGKAPYVLLHGDVRDGGADQEVMEVNLARVHQLRRLLFFVYVYEGAPTLGNVKDATVTIEHPDYPEPLVVELGSINTRSCALVSLKVDPNTGQSQLENVVRPIDGVHPQVDAAFGFGMQWRTDSKR